MITNATNAVKVLNPFLHDLEQRSLLVQAVNRESLQQHLSEDMRRIYAGFDPTAPSLHIGHLVPLFALRRAQLAGHVPIAVIGGATGLIGDPSFKGDERPLQDEDTVQRSCQSIRVQLAKLLDVEGAAGAVLTDNREWTAPLDLIGFLRDIGKHFSVNAMVVRDSVRARLERDDVGISFTEFSYMLLQANDFLELCRRHGCTVQIGGSDQWGNIVSGVDLIRRILNKTAFGITMPLVTKSDGKKFGKSESGAVWLDKTMTSPYSFYQFWFNVADADLSKLLHYFSFKPLCEIEQVLNASSAEPQQRIGQRELAREITALIHGTEAVRSAERIAHALFRCRIQDLKSSDLAQLELDGLTSVALKSGEDDVLSATVTSGLAPSKTACRRLIENGGISVNGRLVVSPNEKLVQESALMGRYHLLRRGKKAWAMAIHDAFPSSDSSD